MSTSGYQYVKPPPHVDDMQPMTKTKAVIIIVGCVMAFLAIVIATNWHKDSAVREAKATITSMLNDPASAQFQNVRTIDLDKDRKLVCGQINARNKFGGYIGYRDFMSNGHIAIMLGSSEQWINQRYWDNYKNEFTQCGVRRPSS